MSRQRYETYMESGVQWLGQLPSHWEVKRLKYSTASCQNGVWGEDPEGDGNDIVCVRVADFYREKLRVRLNNPTIRNVPPSHRISRSVQKGDLLLEKSGGGEKQPVGFVALYDEDQPAVCSNFVACMKLMPGMVPSFWRYVHAAGYSIGLNIPSIKQTSGIQNLDQASYLNERAPYPPVEEQQKIAAFLDRKTAEIDTLIAKKRRLLDRLAEKRTALITRAVTKGLDPDAPMKDSGIEWLGEIPAHWEIVRIRHVTHKIEQGWSPQCENRPASTGEWGVLKVGCVNGDVYDETENKALPLELTPKEHYEVRVGDILVSRANTKELLGSATLVHKTQGKILLCDKLYRLETSPAVDDGFLVRVLRSRVARFQYERDATGTSGSMQNIGQDTLKDLRFACPPLEEQKEIENRLTAVLKQFGELGNRIEGAVDRLEEYRSALITNAVTGQIKVP